MLAAALARQPAWPGYLLFSPAAPKKAWRPKPRAT